MLKGFAEEEAAKILILMDAVRCPKELISSKMVAIVKRFYDHLTRLIYVDATSWKPTDVAQLREYVTPERKTHYVDGALGEYIFPNSALYRRESGLYADIEAFENGKLIWNIPHGDTHIFKSLTPRILNVVEAMSALGIFTKRGLKMTSEIWGSVHFTKIQSYEDTKHLTQRLVKRLIAESLPSEQLRNNMSIRCSANGNFRCMISTSAPSLFR